MRFGGISTEILVRSLMVIIMIITNVYCRFIFIRRLIKHNIFYHRWHGQIHGGDLPSDRGGVAPAEF